METSEVHSQAMEYSSPQVSHSHVGASESSQKRVICHCGHSERSPEMMFDNQAKYAPVLR